MISWNMLKMLGKVSEVQLYIHLENVCQAFFVA